MALSRSRSLHWHRRAVTAGAASRSDSSDVPVPQCPDSVTPGLELHGLLTRLSDSGP